MQQKAVEFSLPSKKNKRHRQRLLAGPCYFWDFGKIVHRLRVRETEDGGGGCTREVAGTAGTALSPSPPLEDSDS